MAEADAEDRQVFGRLLDQPHTDAGLVGRAGAGRQENAVRTGGEGFLDRHFIIADHARFRAQLFQIMDEIPGEAVIIVDDEDLLLWRAH